MGAAAQSWVGMNFPRFSLSEHRMRPRIIHRSHDIPARKCAEEFAGAAEHITRLAASFPRTTSRRDLLKTSLAAATVAMCAGFAGGLLGRTARADDAVKTGKFIFPRLKFSVKDETGDIWNTGLRGDAILRKHLRELTNINVSEEPKTVRLADFDDLCQHPFVFMTSEGYFQLPENEEKNLREFLERGGFIHADDCIYTRAGKHEDRFFRDYVKMIDRLFPDNPMRKVPLDNEIFHIYFDFPKGCPHMQGVDHGMWGQFESGTGRIRTVATPGDLHCGWMSEYFGKEKDMQAIKMGINIIVYFLSH
jgi:hypothetical protein